MLGKRSAPEKDSKRFDVDKEIPGCENYEVCEDPNQPGSYMTKYLMKTEMGKNQNKFYVLQTVKNKTTNATFLWTRYGRVNDSKGQTDLKSMDLGAAHKAFLKKSREKTGGAKGYIEIEYKLGKVNSSNEDKITQAFAAKQQKKADEPQPNIAASKLDPQVQSFVKLIFNKTMMEAAVANVGFDLKKLPIDQLTEGTLKNGYQQLGQIDSLLNANVPSNDRRYADFSAKFYMYIPHNFGFQKMSNFIINTKDVLQKKMSLVSDLIDIKTAYKVQGSVLQLKRSSSKKSKNSKKDEEPNPIDEDYEKLNCKMVTLKDSDQERIMLNDYVQTRSEGRSIKILDVFKIERQGEKALFNPKKLDNKKLLFHGSRFSNYVGILSNGMRIAPPEAPRSGYLFGKGVYFADSAGKSAHYCRPYDSNGIGIFVMCEVAMGKCHEVLAPTHSEHLAPGTSSCHALGRTRPVPSESIMIEKDIEVPKGKTENYSKGYMGVNEFIVYNTNQIRMRYIIKAQM